MFVFLSTDAFQNTVKSAGKVDEAGLAIVKKELPIRRPYRGIQIKEDTYSTLSVRRPDGTPILLTSSADLRGGAREGNIGKVAEYADYILQNLQEQRMEKQQIIETFGETVVYFFGERPRIVHVSGLLINTEDFNWRSQFWYNYENHIRGTKLVQQNARVYLSFDTIIIEGYVLDATAVENSDAPYSIPFNFSMLATNYYDWSGIGQTRFPGGGLTKTLEVLNKDLEDRRASYTSSGAEVRLKNLLADPKGGILSTMRKGIRAINEVVSFASGLTDKIHNVIGGRNVRVPIGIAGYLHSTGRAQVAAGSVGTSATLAVEALGKQYDAKTGTFKGVHGSVKLRMPGTARYAPSWVSPMTGKDRGYICENYDEYPLRKEVDFVSELIPRGEALNRLRRRYARQMAVQMDDVRLAEQNLLAEAGSWLGDLSDTVAFAKANFGMIMSGAAFIREIKDPRDIVKASLGIGIGTTSQSRIAGRKDELSKRGIKTSAQEKANRSLLEKAGRWIGESAFNTFKGISTAKKESAEEASLGEVYKNSAYEQVLAEAGGGVLLRGEFAAGEGFAYESAYGNKNYSSWVSKDPSIRASLDEVYGNNDAAPTGSDIDPASFEEVYRTGEASSSIRSPAEIAAALQAAQSNDVEQDEDTSGITGVDDEDAPIDPIV